MFRKIKYAVLVAKAKSARRKNNFQDAESFMNLAFDVYGGGPSARFHPYANILYASICLNYDKLRAYEACLVAVAQLNSDEYKNDINCAYLIYYCQLIIANTTVYSDSEAHKLLKYMNIKYDQIDINIVSPLIKRSLPLTIELVSELDAFLENLR
ncbi:hypothetical protein Q1W73_04445 [Asticcacaulis sp. ZE23SCel15]|uniref:hypothetical protein n=1 Tax=Asticcacaulis sp. ZE23SCel15 TaxID=3059027 RepID=UPI00265F96E6|nr:hypothetical protein [Asticcacaulis sp. ZE23SCel15]WKL58237.1 hypothetical protein Q1W73_04445 [Asticcacaulis sp. ZE23SCel15]